MKNPFDNFPDLNDDYFRLQDKIVLWRKTWEPIILEKMENWDYWHEIIICRDEENPVLVKDYIAMKKKIRDSIKLLAKADTPIKDSAWFTRLCEVLEK